MQCDEDGNGLGEAIMKDEDKEVFVQSPSIG
jgi:hypothetical protein